MNHRAARKSLNISDKLKIIEEITAGATRIAVARTYGVSRKCITNIYKQRNNIAAFQKTVYKTQLTQHKYVKLPRNVNVDKVLYTWFCQQRAWGQVISGPLLCEKALTINAALGGPASFKASIVSDASCYCD